MGPLFDSGPHGLRMVRNPLISGALQQCSKKHLVEPDRHNRPGPPPDWGPPRSRTGQLLKVVASLSFVSPGLDLLVAHTTSAEKVFTHGNIVYETRSQGLPLYRSTRQLDTTTEPNNDPTLLTARGCFRTATSGRPSLPRRRRSAGRRTCSRRSRAASRWAPLIGCSNSGASFQLTFHGPGFVVVEPNEGQPLATAF